jgi:hypothetical protein
MQYSESCGNGAEDAVASQSSVSFERMQKSGEVKLTKMLRVGEWK